MSENITAGHPRFTRISRAIESSWSFSAFPCAMSAPTGATSDADLARALAAHYANVCARAPEGELLLGPVARHVPSAPPTNARCVEEDGDGEEEELLLRRVAYAPQVLGAGEVVGGVADREVIVPLAVISSTCTSSWGGLVLDANARRGGPSAAEVPGVVLLSSSRFGVLAGSRVRAGEARGRALRGAPRRVGHGCRCGIDRSLGCGGRGGRADCCCCCCFCCDASRCERTEARSRETERC